MMYIEEPDESAHIYSPDSDKVSSRYRKNIEHYWEKKKVEVAFARFIIWFRFIVMVQWPRWYKVRTVIKTFIIDFDYAKYLSIAQCHHFR